MAVRAGVAARIWRRASVEVGRKWPAAACDHEGVDRGRGVGGASAADRWTGGE